MSHLVLDRGRLRGVLQVLQLLLAVAVESVDGSSVFMRKIRKLPPAAAVKDWRSSGIRIECQGLTCSTREAIYCHSEYTQ